MYDKLSTEQRRVYKHEEENIAYKAFRGLITAAHIEPVTSTKRIRKDRYKPEQLKEIASICLNCTREECDGSRRCFNKLYRAYKKEKQAK